MQLDGLVGSTASSTRSGRRRASVGRSADIVGALRLALGLRSGGRSMRGASSRVGIDDPGVLAAAALGAVHHERALPQRHPGEAAVGDVGPSPERMNGRRSTWRGAGRPSHRVGRGGELDDRLGDPVAGVGLHRGAGWPSFSSAVALGADEDAVAAALVGRLHHQLVEVVEHVACGRRRRGRRRSARSASSGSSSR